MSEMKNRIKEELIDFVKMLLISFVSVWLFTTFIAKPVRVSGDSMYPQVKEEQIGFSLVLGKDKIERFDIVVVYVDETQKHLVKRVIGLPNETVRYTDSQLYINDQPVEEDYLDSDYVMSQSNGLDFTSDFEIVLGEDEYFLLGDNRPYSRDSRYYGPFESDDIVSKGILVIYPFQQMGVK